MYIVLAMTTATETNFLDGILDLLTEGKPIYQAVEPAPVVPAPAKRSPIDINLATVPELADVSTNDIATFWTGAQDIIAKGHRYVWTDRQAEVVRKAIRQLRERQTKTVEAAANGAVPCPQEAQRFLVSGQIVSVKQVEDHYRSNRYHTAYTWKWVVQDSRGFKVYGTVPQAFQNRFLDAENRYENPEDLVGKSVRFKANLTRSDRDEFFGFAKRPTGTVVG